MTELVYWSKYEPLCKHGSGGDIMATFRAIAAACEAVAMLLAHAAASVSPVDDPDLQFKVYQNRDFGQPMSLGVSVFPLRVANSGLTRNSAAWTAAGRPPRPPLPLDIHFLITAWARDATLQNTLLGWAMTVLASQPVLTPPLLNAVFPDSFRADESLEVVLGELNTQDLIFLWDKLGAQGYHLSVPYVVRGLQLEALALSGAVNAARVEGAP
jgi:hypothetical protein